MAHAALNAIVTGISFFRDGLFSLKVAHPQGEPVPRFSAGQYAILGLPVPGDDFSPSSAADRRRPPRVGSMLRRAYSVVSPPSERRHAEFYVTEVDGGKLSPLLAKLQQGAPIYMSDRFQGDLTLESISESEHETLPDILMLATGTGIAPFLSMLREYQHRDEKKWRKVVIVHSVREEGDLSYRSMLEHWMAEDPSVSYVPTLTRDAENAAWTGHRGRLQTILDDGTLAKLGVSMDPAQTHVFLCGAPEMVDRTEAMLLPRGFKTWKAKDGGNIHLERYW